MSTIEQGRSSEVPAVATGLDVQRPARHGASVKPATIESKRLGRGPRGFRGRGGGSWGVLPLPPEFRGTTKQVSGLWPFGAGASVPSIGTPIGPRLDGPATIRGDHFAYFRAGYISSPSMSLFGLNGFGKSSFACRMMLGLADRGICTVVAGDLKREYVSLVQAMDGQVIDLSAGTLNLLDLGAMSAAARRIGGERGDALYALAVDRAKDGVAAQLRIIRKQALHDYEERQVEAALEILHAKHRNSAPPILDDLVYLMQNPTQEMVETLEVPGADEHAEATVSLRRSLQALVRGERGRWFNGQTTERLRIDAPAVVIDISSFYRKRDAELAAVMVATWAESFGMIEAANALTDAGLEPQRHYNTLMDEMWRPMRLPGAGLIDAMDGITRLQRNEGSGNMFITHSPKDHQSMDSAADNRKAEGFMERSGMVVTAALGKNDLRALSDDKQLSEAEMNMVRSWSTPPGWKRRIETAIDPITGQRYQRPAPPPGAGKILIKVGGRAGLAAQVGLTAREISLHETNARWLNDLSDDRTNGQVAGDE